MEVVYPWLCCVVLMYDGNRVSGVALWRPTRGDIASYPNADYKVDGVFGESPLVALLDKTLNPAL
jgi:hypothetical protein